MYTGHFGLDDGPFHGKAEGEEVYVGPRQAAVISRLRKALSIGDTAVAVSGPVGVGKTTLVRRAIADIAGGKIVIPVDRIRLEPDEVLDLLLARFDVSRQPRGTIQRVAAFRRLLQERLSNDVSVFIVVEDAGRVGIDALLEIEALTATDGGEPVGANIVLMGDGELSVLLARPALARLRQRIRLRQVVTPFDAAEVEGYMRHCLEAAGGVLEQIFEPGTARIVHRCSGGIARVVDNLCESALVAAAEAGLATILPELLQEVAGNCGLEPQLPDSLPDSDAIDGDAADAAPRPVEEAPSGACAEAAPADEVPEPAAATAAPPKLSLVERPSGRLAEEAPSGETSAAPSTEDGWKAGSASLTVARIDEVLPELIERLQSSARGREPGSAFSPPARPRTDAGNDIPTLSSSMRVAVLPLRRVDETPSTAEDAGVAPQGIVEPAAQAGEKPVSEEVPAEESAKAAASEEIEPPVPESGSFELSPASEDGLFSFGTTVEEESDDDATTEAATLSAEEVVTLAPDAATDVFVEENDAGDAGEPELDALEAAIQAANAWQASDAGEEEAGAAAPRTAGKAGADLPKITLDAELEKQKKPSPTGQLDRWAEELSQAKSLEDISDILAETIFGNEEIESISAEIRAKKAAGRAASEAAAPPPKAAPVTPGPRPKPAPAIPASAIPASAKPASANRAPAKPAPARPAAGGGLSMTLSQRIEMVNSLKGRKPSARKPMPGMPVAEIVLAEHPDEPAPAANGPAPIESQIDTAITQSRKVLSDADLARMASSAADDGDNDGDGNGDGKSSRGLFGFFRRSSKS